MIIPPVGSDTVPVEAPDEETDQDIKAATPTKSSPPIPPSVPPVRLMSHQQGTFVIVILCATLAGQFILAAWQTVLAFASQPSAARWEYSIESPSDVAFTHEMNRLGAEGWEMVTARRATGMNDSVKYEVILKRTKR